MDKIDIIDFSAWHIYEGFPEGSGRSEKLWLQSPEGVIGLFKWPKLNSDNVHTSYEHVSEHLAHQIGLLLDIPTANVEIGTYYNRIGSLSYLINKFDERICEGAEFIIGRHPGYDLNKLFDPDTGKYYSIEHIFEVLKIQSINEYWIDMMFFDFLIGNGDRHQNNWAFILSVTAKGQIRIRPCPLYDNGSSLCCYVEDSEIEQYFGKDRRRIEALVDTKSKSLIRIDPMIKKTPCHSDVVRYLLKEFPHSKEITEKIISLLTESNIDDLLNAYPDMILPYQRKKLLSMYLIEKIRLLTKIRGEVLYGEQS